MPVAYTLCCNTPFPSISDDLIPQMGTFYTLSQTPVGRLKKQSLSLAACIR
ncbi:hypothetical protein [Neisseria sicca]|uniref:hypothetical protein n=1 Tax=Neisseria sicca TaxID=490 RepID=UPI00131EC4B5|nr:hypothetical protein [Neisseria sicca]